MVDDDLKRETLAHSRESEYFSVQGLRTLTGLSESRWDFALVKELLDNALDAVDDLPTKVIEVDFDDDTLRVKDNGPGISPEDLDGVYDFLKYVSNKHDYRTATRGMQGNALKTVIGICTLRGYRLGFAIQGAMHTYTINHTLLEAGFVKFDKKVLDEYGEEVVPHIPGESYSLKIHQEGSPRPRTHPNSAVVISGMISAYSEPGVLHAQIEELIKGLYLSNPDVTFRFNGAGYKAVTTAKKQNTKQFIHHFNFAGFNQLLQATVVKDPNRTVKDFCLSNFSGTQRVLSKMKFDYKRLSDFNTDPAAVRALLKELKSITKPPKAKILDEMLVGEDAFMAMFRGDNDGE